MLLLYKNLSILLKDEGEEIDYLGSKLIYIKLRVTWGEILLSKLWSI